MSLSFLTLMKGQGHTTKSKVTDVEGSEFFECFLFCRFFSSNKYIFFILQIFLKKMNFHYSLLIYMCDGNRGVCHLWIFLGYSLSFFITDKPQTFTKSSVGTSEEENPFSHFTEQNQDSEQTWQTSYDS